MEANNSIVHQLSIMNPRQLLDHWQGHRRLTRKVIEASLTISPKVRIPPILKLNK